MPIFARIIMLLIGTVFIVVGVGVGVFATRTAQAELARAEALEPLNASALGRRGLGSEVLVEGRIDARTPPQFREFVAYTRAEYRGTDDDDDEIWVVDEQVWPELWINAGGVISIATGYQLEGSHERWQETSGLRWNGFTGEGTKRYTGLVVDRPVMAIGTVQPNRDGPLLQAEFVYAGSRDEYLVARRNSTTFLPWFGGLFGLIGAGLIAYPLISLVRR
jgi:hypothetical protein